MRIERQFVFWSLALLIFIGLLFLLRHILLPFVVGAALAYLLAPLANLLIRRRINRLVAVLLIMALFLIVFAGILLLIAPVLVDQLAAFVGKLPGYLSKATSSLGDAGKALDGWSDDLSSMQKTAADYEQQAENAVRSVNQAKSNPDLDLAGLKSQMGERWLRKGAESSQSPDGSQKPLQSKRRFTRVPRKSLKLCSGWLRLIFPAAACATWTRGPPELGMLT